jgi:hypothetical protein
LGKRVEFWGEWGEIDEFGVIGREGEFGKSKFGMRGDKLITLA